MASYDDDDLMEDTEEAQPPQRVRSQVNAVRKQKGRGFREGMDADDERHAGRGYESLESGSGPGPAKCAFPEPSPQVSWPDLLYLCLRACLAFITATRC